MTTKDNGGFAYPQTPAVGPTGDLYHPSEQGWGGGMSLRDYFAACSLTAFDGNPNLPGDPASGRVWPEPEVLAQRRAQWAYLQADAMIAERSK